MEWGKQSKGNKEKGITQKNKKRMVSRSKSRKTIGPCSSSVQASTFRRFPMSPLEQKRGEFCGWWRDRCRGRARVLVCTSVWVVCVWGWVLGVRVGGWMRGVVGMVRWKNVLGEAWQHGLRASLVPLHRFYPKFSSNIEWGGTEIKYLFENCIWKE